MFIFSKKKEKKGEAPKPHLFKTSKNRTDKQLRIQIKTQFKHIFFENYIYSIYL